MEASFAKFHGWCDTITKCELVAGIISTNAKTENEKFLMLTQDDPSVEPNALRSYPTYYGDAAPSGEKHGTLLNVYCNIYDEITGLIV